MRISDWSSDVCSSDLRGQPAPGDLDRHEVHQPRPAVPRPDPGGQYRPDEGGRQVRTSPRLQVLDLRDVVDPPGDHPLDRRPGAHHPHPGAHDRDDRSEEHTSELQSLMRISYAVFCLKKKTINTNL